MEGGTILDRYGRLTIARAVASFYGDMLRSHRLGPYFHNVEMSRLVDHQAAFMAAVMGGPEAFTADHIRTAHQRFNISAEDFEEMLRLLETSLLDHEMSREDTDLILNGYRAYQSEVVAASPGR
jgi:hemoglobin